MCARLYLWAMACFCIPLLVADSCLAEETSSFPYATHRGGVVRVGESSGNRVQIDRGVGKETLCLRQELTAIGDIAGAVDRTNGDLEQKLGEVRDSCTRLRALLAGEFDDGYLEMMVVVLSARGRPSTSGEALESILLAKREKKLQGIVDECKEFDVDRLVVLLKRCDFASAFVDAAALEVERKRSTLKRERTWLEAQAQAGSGEKQQRSRKRAADLGREMQALAGVVASIQEKQTVSERVKKNVDSLQDEYFKTYEKATEVLKAYAATRDKVTRGEPLGPVADVVTATGTDWGKELLRKDTLTATAKAKSAIALLDRRRNPPKATPTPPRKPKPKPAPKKKEGCFVATAVYGNYEHPDVRTLRTFRDDVLATCRPGRKFIQWYYRNGPVAADWLNTHAGCRPVVRGLLATLVCGIRSPFLVLMICGLVVILRRLQKRRRTSFGEVQNAATI